MRKRIIVGMLAIFSLTLPSCDDHDPTVSSNPSKPESVDVDPRVRPSDWALDYWVGDVIEHKDLNERNLYYPREVFICYMDSAYSDNIGQDGTVDYEKNVSIIVFTLKTNPLSSVLFMSTTQMLMSTD